MPNFKVVSPIRKDAKDYAIGDTIQLSPKEADGIAHAVERIPDAAPASQNGNGDPDLSKLTKAQLVEFATATYSLTLDPDSSKGEMLAAIAKAAEEKK